MRVRVRVCEGEGAGEGEGLSGMEVLPWRSRPPGDSKWLGRPA